MEPYDPNYDPTLTPEKSRRNKKQMNVLVWAILGIVGIALAGVLISAASAQEVGTPAYRPATTWSGMIADFVFMACSAIVTALLAWVSSWIKAKFNIDIEAKHRQALHSAIMTGVAAGLRKVRSLEDGGQVVPDAKAIVENTALEWVKKSVPDALKFFNIGPINLVDFLLPMISAKVVELSTAQPAVVYTPNGVSRPGE